MTKLSIFIISLMAFICFSCTKDIGKRPIQEPSNSNLLPTYIPPNFNCLPLDSILTQSGNVKDTVADPLKLITYWKYNPSNPNELIYVVGYDIYYYNTVTRNRRIIGNRLMYLPQISKKGWVLFTTIDFECFLVKVNGDSLTQITFDGATNARWYFSDTVFYCYKMQNNFLYKRNLTGLNIDSVYSPQGELLHAVFSSKSSKIAFQNFFGGKYSVYVRDLSNGAEFVLFDGGGQMEFDYSDSYLYVLTEATIQNPGAVLRCDLNTKKIDTLFKNCYNNRFVRISLSSDNKLCLVWQRTTLMFNRTRRFYEYRTFEVNLDSPKLDLKEVLIFP